MVCVFDFAFCILYFALACHFLFEFCRCEVEITWGKKRARATPTVPEEKSRTALQMRNAKAVGSGIAFAHRQLRLWHVHVAWRSNNEMTQQTTNTWSWWSNWKKITSTQALEWTFMKDIHLHLCLCNMLCDIDICGYDIVSPWRDNCNPWRRRGMTAMMKMKSLHSPGWKEKQEEEEVIKRNRNSDGSGRLLDLDY